jgi:hypothetical protein
MPLIGPALASGSELNATTNPMVAHPPGNG